MSLHWSARYIGIDWQLGGRTRGAADCYGLVRLVLREQAGIDLDAATDAAAVLRGADELASTADRIAAGRPWLTVSAPGREFDIAVFRSGVHTRHIGILTGPGIMLHITDGAPSCLARTDQPRWHSRLLGLLRHESTLGHAMVGTCNAEPSRSSSSE